MERFAVSSIDNFRYTPSKSGTLKVYIDDSISSIGLLGDDDPGYTKGALRRIDHMASGITEILPGAFKGCSSLAYADVPDTVVNIGDNAFSDCVSLNDVTLFRSRTTPGASIQRFGKRAFYNTGLKDITLDIVGTGTTSPDTEYVFAECRDLRSVKYLRRCPMYDYGFYGCTSLTSVTFPEYDVPNWQGKHTFEDCTSLKSIAFPEWFLQGIDNYMFAGCTSLTEVDVSKITSNTITYPSDFNYTALAGVTKTWDNYSFRIGTHAFDGCTSLTSFTFPPLYSNFVEDKFILVSPSALKGSSIQRLVCPGMAASDIESSPEAKIGFGSSRDIQFFDGNGELIYTFLASSVPQGGDGDDPGDKYTPFEDYDMLYEDVTTKSGFVTGTDVWYSNAKEAILEAVPKGTKICLMTTGGENCSTCESMYKHIFSSSTYGNQMTEWMRNSGILFLYDYAKSVDRHNSVVAAVKSLGLSYSYPHLPCFNFYQMVDGVPKSASLGSPQIVETTTSESVFKWLRDKTEAAFIGLCARKRNRL